MLGRYEMLNAERKTIVEICMKMLASGLIFGTGGNVSIADRTENLVAMTPSGISYDKMGVEDVVITDTRGKRVEGRLEPTSEVDLHLFLYKRRPDISAVVHTHSPYVTTLACLGWEIPPISYLICDLGGRVPFIPYRTFGTHELAEYVSERIGAFNAAIMGNHGLVSVGCNLEEALRRAETTEFLAEIYWRAKSVGEPRSLNKAELERASERFRSYGQRDLER